MSTNRATAAIKKASDSTTADRAECGEVNKAKTNETPGSEKPSAPAPRTFRLTEKSQLLMKELGINDPDLLIGLLGQILDASRKGAEVDHMDFDFTLAFVKGSKPRDPIETA